MKNRPKLKASSLIEVVVAMTILLIILTSAGMVYVRLTAQRPDRQLRIEHQLSQLAARTKAQRDFTDVNIELTEWGIEIVRECRNYQAQPDVIYLLLTAYANSGVPISEYRELVFIADGED